MTVSADTHVGTATSHDVRWIGRLTLAGLAIARDELAGALAQVRPRMRALAVVSGLVVIACLLGPGNLAVAGRLTLAIMMIAVVYWALSDVPDVVVGLLATAALVAGGVVGEAAVLQTLGHEFIWLLMVAFAIGAVIRDNRLVDWCFNRCGLGALSLPRLFAALTLLISVTAFLIPSTSARAAILLPIFMMLAQNATTAQRTALGLLFPTTILLSAGGSLIGAGAHAVAAQFLSQHAGRKVDLFTWALLALPFAMLTTLAAAATIFVMFIPRNERNSCLVIATRGDALTPEQWRSLLVIAVVVAGWITTPLHGVGMALIGLVGLAILLVPGFSGVGSKAAFKAIELELLVFLATTFVLADALVRSGAGQALSGTLLASLPQSLLASAHWLAVALGAVGLLAHLFVTSRTARVTVLMPTLVLPLVGLGFDPTTLIMITVLSTGFCQTLPASAKPVGVYAGLQPAPFRRTDLLKLSLALLPQMLVAISLYASVYG